MNFFGVRVFVIFPFFFWEEQIMRLKKTGVMLQSIYTDSMIKEAEPQRFSRVQRRPERLRLPKTQIQMIQK